MILVRENSKIKYIMMKVKDLSLGQMFLTNLDYSDVYMKINNEVLNNDVMSFVKTTLKGFEASDANVEEYQAAIRLKDGELFIFDKNREVYLVDGTLKWEVIVDANA